MEKSTAARSVAPATGSVTPVSGVAWVARSLAGLGAALLLVVMACSGNATTNGPLAGGGGTDGGGAAADGAAGAVDTADTGTVVVEDSAAPVRDGSTGSIDSGKGGDAGSKQGTIPADAGTTGPTGASTGLLVQVTNSCPVDVWIHGTGQEGTLAPDNVHLVPGATQQYNGPLTWTAARIYAYVEAPDGTGTPQGQNDKVEMNFSNSGGVESMNTDVTYVDWVALPSRIQAIGSGSGCTTVGCEVSYAKVLDGCPSSLLTGHECVSAGGYCLNAANGADPLCHALDSQIPACAADYTDCAGASGATTAEVYSCSGTFFSQSPEYCAALNRGVLGTPGASTPPSAFYVGSPYNAYAAWVHKTCPGIYAFPYDDFGSSNQSSDETCSGATQLNITFCPQG